MKYFILIVLLFIVVKPATAQENNTKYLEVLDDINEYISANEYIDALPLLLNLIASGQQSENIYYKLGLCYLHSARSSSLAINCFERAAKNVKANYDDMNPTEKYAPFKTLLYLGDTYRLNNHLDNAERAYKRYLAVARNDLKSRKLAEKRINECHIAKLFALKPIEVKFEKLASIINNGTVNYNPCLSGDGKTMVFTRKLKFYDGIYCCKKYLNGWTETENITNQVGSDGDFWPSGLSFDGKRLLLISYDKSKGFDLFESKFQDGKWTKVKKLNNNVNTPYNEIDGVYAPDGKSIYFASNRKTGRGGYDIYSSTIDHVGNCGQAVNLGNIINTESDEISPTFTDNGRTLIFSSQRSPGMGGFDYFYALKDSSGHWKKVYNVGYPLNSLADDMGLSTSSKGEGIVAKYDPTSNVDKCIYSVKFGSFSQFSLVPISGEIKSKNSDISFKGTRLYFIDEATRDTVGTVEEPDSGKYNLDMYPGDFKLLLVKNEVQLMSQAFAIPVDKVSSSIEYQLVSNLSEEASNQLVSEGSGSQDTLIVPDIYFSYNQSEISEKDRISLEKLISKLKNHKITGIELIGYSDSTGREIYNRKLSEQRATSVQKIFEKHGFPERLISSMGAGATNFIAKNVNPDGTDNPEGRTFNRRVEIYITSVERNLMLVKQVVVPPRLKP
jgi:outer membrane protein OmpA-like peptidoglycan-associated protein/tetratricopeptide (TPR) repeat protein